MLNQIRQRQQSSLDKKTAELVHEITVSSGEQASAISEMNSAIWQLDKLIEFFNIDSTVDQKEAF